MGIVEGELADEVLVERFEAPGGGEHVLVLHVLLDEFVKLDGEGTQVRGAGADCVARFLELGDLLWCGAWSHPPVVAGRCRRKRRLLAAGCGTPNPTTQPTRGTGMADDDKVTISVETATETVTRDEDVDRIRREAGLEQGTPPPRGVPSGEDSKVGDMSPRGEAGSDGNHDHTIDEALARRDDPSQSQK